ncbi:MAG: flippase-like domain-containing protein [Paludibacteraceae bacterium]|nr:flippase-like domain-containing protein [Paludibacteraceae bacterium]
MKRSNILKALQWLLVAAAYGYLGYRLAVYDDWQSLYVQFGSAGVWQYICLTAAVLLFPLNILFESMKWQYLMRDIEPMTIGEAQRQTYFGFIGAFVTPSRLGDYPARVSMMQSKNRWLEAVTLGFTGTLALAFLQVMAGMPSCILLLENIGGMRWVEWLCGAVWVLQVLTIVFYRYLSRQLSVHIREGKIKDTLEQLSRFSHKRFLITLLYSFLRYVVYCIQLWLVLEFCGIHLSFTESLAAIPAYYLLVTVTPSVPVADAVVRGSWSVVIFSMYSDNIPAIAVAAVLLWLLNTILPILVSTLLPKNRII